jgi:hypothetical protein
MSTTKPRRSDEDESLFPLPYTRELFEMVSEEFLLPKSYLETLHRGATMFLQLPPGYNDAFPDAHGANPHLPQNIVFL